MAISIHDVVAAAMADALVAQIDAGAGPSVLKVYTGGKPATVATAATGTLLATFTLTDPSAESQSGGVITVDLNPDINATVVADGTPGYFRIETSDGAAKVDGTVGTSNADLIFDDVTWLTGGTVSMKTGTLTVPLG